MWVRHVLRTGEASKEIAAMRPPDLGFDVELCWFMFVCMGISSVYHMHTVTEETDEHVKSPRTGVTDTCEPPCGCWEPLGADPVENQLMLLTAESGLDVLICHSLSLRASGFFSCHMGILPRVAVAKSWCLLLMSPLFLFLRHNPGFLFC